MPDEQAKSLAAAVQALRQVNEDFAEVKTDFKNRITVLETTINRLSHDILFGQAALPLEPAESKGNGEVPKPKRSRPAPPPSEPAPF